MDAVDDLGGDSVIAAESTVSGPYPGGKFGAGIYQRLINLIPRHKIFVSAFAGHCGITRKIKPAEHTIVIDADAKVCQWWDDWRRRPEGRILEIHHCDSSQWLRHRFEMTKYPNALDGGTAGPLEPASAAGVAESNGGQLPQYHTTLEYFIFCDPPYVLSQRSHGKQYACELTDDQHRDLLCILTRIPEVMASIMLCGYPSNVYAAVDPWRSIAHRVPTRGGLQDEVIWMNYDEPEKLHDHQFVGSCNRARERIRRRQKNWLAQLAAMGDRERAAMVEVINAEG